MHLLLGLLGVLLLATGVSDLLWTAFLEGAGPITTRLNRRLARMLLTFHGRGTSRFIITSGGLVTSVATVMMWALLIWFGWALIFCADPGALVSTTDPSHQANIWERFYSAGDLVTTLGLGEFRPVGRLWQFLTITAGGSGFLLFGLALAYLVPVIQAATQKRQAAVYIWSLGRSPQEIILRAWNGIDTTALGPHLVSLTGMLALLGESHLTYPVLHFFSSTKRSAAVAPGVAALDEALTILECGLQQGCSLDLPSLGAARLAITEFLQTLKPALIHPAEEVPPSPSLGGLRDSGVPVVDDALFDTALAGLAARRRLLLALVQNEGWTWDSVWPADADL